MSHRLKTRSSRLGIGLLVLLCSATARADDAVSITAQAVLFKKILSYDYSIVAGQDRVVVPYDNLASRGVAEEIARALSEAGLKATAIGLEQMANLGADTAAVYVIPGPSVAAIKEACMKKKVLSISGSAQLAESGEVAVAVRRIEGGRTEIVVHLGRAQDQKQQLAAALLGLAKVIR